MMTPGTYVRLRRTAARRSLLDVAVRLDTEPHVPAHDRVDWLAAIEADRLPVTERIAIALYEVLPIDLVTISRLQAHADGVRDVPAPLLCAHCGAGVPGGCADQATPAAGTPRLDDIPDSVLSMSNSAMLRHTGQPSTLRGLQSAAAMARSAGWVWDVGGMWRRPLLLAVLRS